MKFPTLGTRDKRALTLGVAITVPALLYVFAVAPAWRAITSQRAELNEATSALTREQALIAQAPSVQHRSTQMNEWLTGEARRLFDGEDDIAATSGLSDYVTRTAGSAGVQIRQTETRPPIRVSGSLNAIRLNVQVEGSVRSIMTFLQSLEGGQRLIRVGSVAMTSSANFSQLLQAGMTDGPRRQPLSMTAELYGYAFLPTPDSLRIPQSQQGASYASLGNAHVDAIDVSDAIAHDPFHPDRAAPPPVFAKGGSGPPPFPIRLVGTAVDPDGNGFALCQHAQDAPVVVHQGEQIAGYTLRSIERGSIILAAPNGKVIHLSIPTPEA